MDGPEVSRKSHFCLVNSIFHLVTTKARQEYQNAKTVKNKTSTLSWPVLIQSLVARHKGHLRLPKSRTAHPLLWTKWRRLYFWTIEELCTWSTLFWSLALYKSGPSACVKRYDGKQVTKNSLVFYCGDGATPCSLWENLQEECLSDNDK